jgi:undecaprenyl-diphosphatase
VIIFIIGGKKGKKVAIMGLLGIGLTSLLVLIIKPLVGEPRPFLSLAHVNLLVVETGVYSFPSGHTSLIFTLATILGLNYEFKIFKRKILFIYPALIIAGIVGFSRIYVGVHYPFDIIGGMILGIISGLTVIKLCKYIFKIKKIEKILS